MMKAAKAAFRKEMKLVINSLTPEEKTRQSDIVVKKLLSLPEFKKSKRVSIFLSMSDEIQTNEILKFALEDQKTCFIPRYDSTTTRMDMIRLDSWSDYENLPETKWNIKQPPLNEERIEAMESGGLDLILIPGMAFTKAGDRMGRGRGYYDTYLRRYSQEKLPPPLTVALAFKEQIVDDIPTEETDVPIKMVLYPY